MLSVGNNISVFTSFDKLSDGLIIQHRVWSCATQESTWFIPKSQVEFIHSGRIIHVGSMLLGASIMAAGGILYQYQGLPTLLFYLILLSGAAIFLSGLIASCRVQLTIKTSSWTFHRDYCCDISSFEGLQRWLREKEIPTHFSVHLGHAVNGQQIDLEKKANEEIEFGSIKKTVETPKLIPRTNHFTTLNESNKGKSEAATSSAAPLPDEGETNEINIEIDQSTDEASSRMINSNGYKLD
jgi:hypothetical protein